MDRLRGAWARLRALSVRGRAESEMDDELRFHVEMETEKYLREGASPAEARRRALLAFGGMERHREAMRDGRRVGWLEDLLRDVRFAARALARNPALALVAGLTIALGVGGTTAVFSIANALLFRPLPVAEPGRLFVVQEQRTGSYATGMEGGYVSMDRFRAYEEATRSVFSGLAAQRYSVVSLQTDRETLAVNGVLATPNYFEVLGVRPELGRPFAPSGGAEAVISHSLWRSRFGEDPAVLGAPVHLNGQLFTVVGVAPRGFGGTLVGMVADVWVPAAEARTDMRDEAVRPVAPFGRLRPGVPEARAAAAVDAAAKSIPVVDADVDVSGAMLEAMTGVPAEMRAPVAAFLAMLLGAATLVLLIASANIAGMLLARAVARRREVAIRLAMGAGRGRVVRQLLTESVLLFLLGGAGGIALAYVGTDLLNRIRLPAPFPIVFDLSPDPVVLGLALAVTAATGMVFGLAPALQTSRPDVADALKGAAANERFGRTRGRSLFVAGQLALSVVLLVAAGLFVRALQRGLAVEPGFDAEGVVVATVGLRAHAYDEAAGREFYRRLLERTRELPGVESASLSSVVLLTGSVWSSNAHSVDHGRDGRVEADVSHTVVEHDYFRTLRIPLEAGRTFTPADRAGAPRVAVVNRTLAETMWPGESPLGKRFQAGEEYTVVGVALDGKYQTPGESPRAFAFFSAEQQPSLGMTLHARAPGREAETLERIRREVRALDPSVAVQSAMPLPAMVGVMLFPQRFAAGLVGLFGAMGLVLAGVGVYGVLAFQVAQRTRELGIRIALGAGRRELLRLVVGRGALLAVAGAAAGLVLAAGVTRFLRGFLFGLSPVDPVTFVGVPLLLCGVALLASWVPARRATRLNPMEALRRE